MDRDRLKDIQTADLAESNVNEDFILWLKTKGPNYLLIAMVLIAGYLFLVRHQQNKATHHAEAWIAYLEASASGLPASHEDVATAYSDIDAIEGLGYISAADAYLKSIILNKTVGNAQNTIETILNNEDRIFYLNKAETLYQKAIDIDNQTAETTLLVISGLNGRAAIAETRGDVKEAQNFYEQVIARVGNQYPALANQAQLRINTLNSIEKPIVLPTETEVTSRSNEIITREAAPSDSIIDALTEIVEPKSE